jgi:PAS domain S-box-containing protein
MLRRLNHFGLLEAFVTMVTALFLVLTLLDYINMRIAARAEADAVLLQSEHSVTMEVQRLIRANAGSGGVESGLKDLSSFLADSTSQSAGTAIVVADLAENIIASSDVATLDQLVARRKQPRPSLADPPFSAERAAVQARQRDGRAFHEIDTADGVAFARVSELTLDQLNRVRIVLTVPRSVFTASFYRAVTWKLVACLLLLVAASLFYLRRYILPLRELVRLMGEADFSRPELFPTTARRDEVGMLYRHINEMTGKLTAGIDALSTREEHYRLLAENMRDVIWQTTCDYRFTYVSPSGQRWRGFRSALVLGQPIWSTFTENSEKEFLQLVQRQREALQRGERIDAEVFQAEQLAEQGKIWVEIVSTPVYEGETLTGFQGISRDISSRRKAEEAVRSARDYLKNILNTIADPIIVKDHERRLVLVNEAARRLFGCSLDDLVGKTDYDFFPREQADVFSRIDAMVLETGTSNINEEALTDTDGRMLSLITHKTRYVAPDGQRFVVAAIRDVTELREAQENSVASARQAGMAEIAINVLHNVGNVLNSVGVSAGQAVSMVRGSHVAGLQRAVGLMNERSGDLPAFLMEDSGKLLAVYLNKLAETLTKEQRSVMDELQRLRNNVDHIADIIATQQRYAGTSSVIQPVRVRGLLDDALQMNAELLSRHAVKVVREFDELGELPLDKARIILIVVNLIRNAVYAMAAVPDRPHQLTLRMELARVGELSALRISVIDNGEGIATENLTRIFVHGFTTRNGGHGFGLHSCALAAGEMGGSLTAHSDGPGTGACFTLDIPITFRN